MTSLQNFLYEQKVKLLDLEKRAIKSAKVAVQAQVQVIDSIFVFLSSEQKEEDMAKLQLSLDKQARPLDELKPRQETAELTEAIVELAESLKPNSYKILTLPANVKPKSVSSKVYGLRKAGKLPTSIVPITRGKDMYLARKGG